MNNKALTLSLVMAVLAVFFVSSYVTSIEDEAKKKFGTEVLVLKAKRDIKEMDTVTENMLYFDKVPKSFLAPSAVSFDKDSEDKETAKGLKTIAGAIALVPIKKDEQISWNKLTEAGLRTGLAPEVTPGRRAFAISVNEISGVSKLIKPGDRVDLIAVIDVDGKKENKIAKTILQDVVVLSTGKNVTNNVSRVIEADPFGGKDKIRSLAEDSSFATVTLEVEPSQVQMLALLAANGDNALSLALRNNNDVDRQPMVSTTVRDVLGMDIQRVPTAVRR